MGIPMSEEIEEECLSDSDRYASEWIAKLNGRTYTKGHSLVSRSEAKVMGEDGVCAVHVLHDGGLAFYGAVSVDLSAYAVWDSQFEIFVSSNHVEYREGESWIWAYDFTQECEYYSSVDVLSNINHEKFDILDIAGSLIGKGIVFNFYRFRANSRKTNMAKTLQEVFSHEQAMAKLKEMDSEISEFQRGQEKGWAEMTVAIARALGADKVKDVLDELKKVRAE